MPESEKEGTLRIAAEIFDTQHNFEKLIGKERAKTPEELKIIDLANQATNEVRARYGLGAFDIPAKNIHVMKKEDWPSDEKGVGLYIPGLQAVALEETRSGLEFLHGTIHEMTHFKSYNALQRTKGEKRKLDFYRTGLQVCTRDGKKEYLENLNEAVTEELTKKAMSKFREDPLFQEEVESTNKNIASLPDDAVNVKRRPFFYEETFYIRADKKWWKKRFFAEQFSYPEERNILHTLTKKIQERNKDAFENPDEVFDVFARAMMTGHLLALGKLIDRTFGKGTLRKLGEVDPDIEERKKFVENL